MAKPPPSVGWTVATTTLQASTLVELYQLLDGSPAQAQRVAIQKELVARVRQTGRTTVQILATLVAGVGPRHARPKIAKNWAEALDLTEQEARRLTD